MAQMKRLSRGLRLFVISAADFKANAMASLEQVGGGHDLDGELINLAGDQRLWIRMRVEWLPRFRPFRVYLSM
jgi:hypothetical protein